MKYSCVYGLVGGLELEEAALKLKECGYDGIEFAPAPFMKDAVVDKRARKINESELDSLCEKAGAAAGIFRAAGIEIMGFAPGYFAMDYFDDDFFEPYYKLASAIGSPGIKIAGIRYNSAEGGYWRLLEESERKLRVLTGYGKKYGVRSLIELHFNFLAESCSGAYNMLRNFSPELTGVIHDPQNMVVAGKENWRMGLDILGDYLDYVHFKNSIFKRQEDGSWKWELSSLEEGLVDWREFMAALKETGFKGYLCNEYRGGRDDVPAEKYLLDELNYIKKIEAEA